MTGTSDYLPVMADCERALGRPAAAPSSWPREAAAARPRTCAAHRDDHRRGGRTARSRAAGRGPCGCCARLSRSAAEADGTGAHPGAAAQARSWSIRRGAAALRVRRRAAGRRVRRGGAPAVRRGGRARPGPADRRRCSGSTSSTASASYLATMSTSRRRDQDRRSDVGGRIPTIEPDPDDAGDATRGPDDPRTPRTGPGDPRSRRTRAVRCRADDATTASCSTWTGSSTWARSRCLVRRRPCCAARARYRSASSPTTRPGRRLRSPRTCRAGHPGRPRPTS